MLKRVTKSASTSLKLISWNVSSMKSQIFEKLRLIQPNICCLQEVRNYEFRNTPYFTYIYKKKNKDIQGGGLCIRIDNQINFRTLDHLITEEIQQLNFEVQIIQTFHSQFSYIIINMYIPSINKFGKKKLKILYEWLQNLIIQNNQEQFIVCGDFNNTANPFPFLQNLNQKNEYTFQRVNTKQVVLDYILISFKSDFQFSILDQNRSSDHRILQAEIEIQNNLNFNQNFIKIPSKTLSYQICMLSEKLLQVNSKQDIVQFLKIMQSQKKKIIPYQKIRITLKKRKSQLITFKQIVENIDKFLRTNQSTNAYKWIQRLSIVNPGKRENSLVKCQLREDQSLITNQNSIYQNCVDHLVKIQGQNIHKDILKKFPNLQSLSIQQILHMQKQISKNKAVTMDGFSDNWIKECQNKQILADMWNDQVMQILSKASFEARLIPLNKAAPDIPTLEQFRPIAILSNIIKWIELRFQRKLQDYINFYLDKDQIGFVEKCSTSMGIKLLIDKIKKIKKKDKQIAIFIDLKMAYNTVNRNLLFQIIKSKNILTIDETNFLQTLYNNIYFKTEQGKYYLKNGLQQGSTLSPLFFNIYMDQVIKKLEKEFGQIKFKKLFADDMVVIIPQKDAIKFINILKQVFYRFDLLFNTSKSKVFILQRKDKDQEILVKEIAGLEVVDQYNYLGIRISRFGSLLPHYNFLKLRCNYLGQNLGYYSKHLVFKNRYLIWIIYIKSLFNYCSSVLQTQTKKIRNKFKSLYNKSFKRFMQLPLNLPNSVLDYLVENFDHLCHKYGNNLNQKINDHFKLQLTLEINQDKLNISNFDLQKIQIIPNDFLRIFNQQSFVCSCHNRIMNYKNIVNHLDDSLKQKFMMMISQKISISKQNRQKIQSQLNINNQTIKSILNTINKIKVNVN